MAAISEEQWDLEKPLLPESSGSELNELNKLPGSCAIDELTIFIGYPKTGRVDQFECTDTKEEKAVKNIATKNLAAATAALCSMKSLKSHIFVESTKQTMKEAVNYSESRLYVKSQLKSGVFEFCN
ncbi:hypothetical protein OS493_020107 [Desmophyllum pertusum]|uniref:Uncharacterized protein n=1 Tax=Desmophyllum pertusum TaxID=174260 RepID=A0A9X0A0X7_9CNID|nr:hypothetical protein OS493_020107 [Desmophyllum pertusum]